MAKRTDLCGTLRESDEGKRVTLKGWVQRRRDFGGLIFIDLRDTSGLIQIVFDPGQAGRAFQTAEEVRNEYVVEVQGIVVRREPGSVNRNIATGEIEIRAEALCVLNEAKTPPFSIEGGATVSEEVRLKHRYLDLRRPEMQRRIKARSKMMKVVRDLFDEEGFIEVETPFLTKSTPEGARDYLVPSRVHPGEFFALPQSPQIFKQLLMVGGFEKYYQIVRCFRDEDLRADRQPEFTQIDVETSFWENQEDLFSLIERLMARLVQTTRGIRLPLPFPRMTYEEALDRYGSDKPDTRFDMELVELSSIFTESEFQVFRKAVEAGGVVKAINVKGAANDYSRREIEEWTNVVKPYGAKGLAWLKVEKEKELKGPIAKFIHSKEAEDICTKAEAEEGDLLLFIADRKKVAQEALGALRIKLGTERGLADKEKLNFLWVTEFPLFEYDEEKGRYVAQHHPFTMPRAEDMEHLESDPSRVRAEAYDLVLNGYELGSGSARIYRRDIQNKMFRALGIKDEEAQEKFGFLLEAFEYGTPPHGGIALGFDRIVMLLAGGQTLRDVIAFPKTASASDLMMGAPGEVNEEQLKELHLEVRANNE